MGFGFPSLGSSEKCNKLVSGERSDFRVSVFGRSSCRMCNPVLKEDLTTLLSDEFLGSSPESRFGLDIGGTLCKLVYFEPRIVCVYHRFDDTVDRNVDESLLNSGEQNHPTICNHHRSPNFTTPVENVMSPEERHCDGSCEYLRSELSSGSSVSASDWGSMASDASTTCLSSGDDCNHKSLQCPSDCSPCISQHCKSRARKLWRPSHDSIELIGKGTIHFKCFETRQVEEFLQLSKELSLVTGNKAIGATGGGARKFGQRFLTIAGLHLHRADELTCLVHGIDFLVRNAIEDCFEFEDAYKAGIMQRYFSFSESSSEEEGSEGEREESTEGEMKMRMENEANRGTEIEKKFDRENERVEMKGRTGDDPTLDPNSLNPNLNDETKSSCETPFRKRGALERENFDKISCSNTKLSPLHDFSLGFKNENNLYPYLVVNIGSGVSILRVDSPDKFERVGGTSLGGSTFLGLTSALTDCENFQEAIGLASRGDSTQVDMLVGDIYGGDYTEMNLAASTVASSFGKLVDPFHRENARKYPANLAKAALIMVTNNIGSLAMLHAKPAGVDRILFAGSFMHHNKLAMKLLSGAVEFWSQGKMKAMFLRHEGHAGAIGALLSALDAKDPVDSLLLTGDADSVA